MSRFVPLTKVRDLATSLKLKDLEGPKMRTFLAAGVNKVLRHQHDDGHFSLWPAGPTYPHLTAYALWGLGEAKRAGVAVPDEPLGRGASALKKWVNDPGRTLEPGNEAGTLAMAAYVLGTLGHGDASLNARLYAARAGLPIYGQAFLLRAMAGAKARKADLDTLRRELEARVVVRGAAATVAEKDPRPWEVMSSNVRSTAMVLSALVEVAPESPLIPKLVDGLREARRPTGAWSSTQENVWSLVAMADVARRAAVGRAEVTVKLGDAVLEKGAIEGGATLTVARRLDQVKPGLIALEASTPVRWTVRVTTARKIADDPAIARGFTVSRRYVDVKSGQVIERVAAGQLVKVIIDVVPARPQAWVAVDDPLPAGFEPVQQGLATSEEVQGAQSQAGTWRGWDHLELRDQRALAFADRLSAPTQLTYLARATLPGKFTAPGTTALAMYDDGVRGRGASQTIEVDP